MHCRGIRVATTAEENTAKAILSATRELLALIVEANDLKTEDVASAIFTTTPDLTTAFPARAAREMGWQDVALLDVEESHVLPAHLPCRPGGEGGRQVGRGGEDGAGHIFGLQVVGLDDELQELPGGSQNGLGCVLFRSGCTPNTTTVHLCLPDKQKSVGLSAPRF